MGLTLPCSVVLVIRVRGVTRGANRKAEFTSVGAELGPQGSIMVRKLFVRDKTAVWVDLEATNIPSALWGKGALPHSRPSSTSYRAFLSLNMQ